MNEALTFMGALLGSGAVVALITFYLNAGKDQTSFMRKKAEELYIAFESFDRNLGGHFLTAYPLIKGEISWNEFNDLRIKNFDKRDADAALQIMMLIDIYFPDVKPAFDGYLEQRDTLGRILSDHKSAYKAGKAEAKQFFEPFHKAMLDLNAHSKKLKQVIISEAHKFSRPGRFWIWKSH